MSENKIIVNKHFEHRASITNEVFTDKVKDGKKLSEGEIIISNDPEEPGLFIKTHGESEEIVNVSSPKNAKLSPDYTEASGSGSEIVVKSGDTIEQAIGKLSKQVKEASENAMPKTGDGLKIEEIEGVKTLSVDYDGFTIIKNAANKLQVNPEIIGSGGTSHIYTPGEYIDIDPETFEISVTGITPDDYVTKEEFDPQNYATKEDVEDVASAVTECANDVETLSGRVDSLDNSLSGISENVNEISGKVDTNKQAMDEGFSAVTESLSELNEKVDNLDPSSAKVKSTTITSSTTTFIGLDGVEHAPGIYLVLEFGPESGESTYSYSEISALINAGSVYLTEDEYAALVESGQVDPNVTYYTYETEE